MPNQFVYHKLAIISLSRQQGFTLLEVVFALFIITIGLLGLMTLQVNAASNNRSALRYTQAEIALDALAEQLQVYPKARYAELIQTWQEHLTQILPNTNAVVKITNSQLHAQLCWKQANLATCQEVTLTL